MYKRQETENIIYLVSTDGAIYKYILGDSDSLKAPFIAAESGVSITAPLQLNQQSGELYVTYTEELKDESKIVVYSKDGKVLHTVDCGAVSYTHLDVYKRQTLPTPTISTIRK